MKRYSVDTLDGELYEDVDGKLVFHDDIPHWMPLPEGPVQ